MFGYVDCGTARRVIHAISRTLLQGVTEWIIGARSPFAPAPGSALIFALIRGTLFLDGLSRDRLAKEMGTSRSQISRLLDPNDGNVTLMTLQRAAEMLDRKVRLELV